MIKEYIKRLIEAGWTQNGIAAATGIPQSSINRVLSGRQLDLMYSAGKRIEQLAKKRKERE